MVRLLSEIPGVEDGPHETLHMVEVREEKYGQDCLCVCIT